MGKAADLPPIFCKQCGYCLYGLPEPRCPECGRAFDPADARSFRSRPLTRRWRWVAWAAVALILAAMVPAGMWVWLYWAWKQEQPAIARLSAKGEQFQYTVIGPDWVRRWMPDKAAFVLRRAQKANGGWRPSGFVEVTDGDLDGVGTLSELEELEIEGSGVTDASIRGVDRLRKLKALTLLETGITDRGLGELKSLRGLERLWVRGSPVGAGGLELIRRNTDLKMLVYVAPQPGLGKEAVPAILECSQLVGLALEDTQLTDADLDQLVAGLQSLKVLYVNTPEMTDARCQRLRRLRPGLVINPESQNGYLWP